MSEASLNVKLHKGAHSRLKAEIDSLKKWREDHYPKVRSMTNWDFVYTLLYDSAVPPIGMSNIVNYNYATFNNR